ncbi:MAG: hypothetical protein EOO27_10140 [Comamonadaceae bacterium]|nr:MAG: hypothetical protein EOO27_10140 [Comamonadaceae bacterium]
MFNRSLQLLGSLAAAAALFASGSALAESTYGYNAAGAGPVSATAKVNVQVSVPLLILLRVGVDNTAVDTVAFASTPTIPGGPGTLVGGSSQAGGWSGAAPTFATTATNATLLASAWTNASNNGQLSCAVTTAFPAASGLTSANITVTSATVGGTGLAHPGANTACGTNVGIPRNVVQSSNWTYGLTGAIAATAAAGTVTETVTYTAVTL